jgi:putative transcriptional regulator
MHLKREKLFETRKQQKMTLQQVADRIGVSKPYYWQIENGERGLSYGLAIKISSVFDSKPDDIFLTDELTKSEQTNTA